ncbi:MAG: DUF721 domain-containing protein [Phycisphaeraceae bacterium]|nr:DUF721 domain-containing protein [Phycisphaeraceae bacterium]
MSDRMASLQDLRRWRVRPERGTDLAAEIASQVRQLGARQRQGGRACAAWEAAAPAVLRASCEVKGTGSGVLTVRAGSAGVRFQLDRWLKGGGEALLRSGGVTRVKLV